MPKTLTLLLLCMLPAISRAAAIHDATAAGSLAKVQALLSASPGVTAATDTPTLSPLGGGEGEAATALPLIPTRTATKNPFSLAQNFFEGNPFRMAHG